MTEHDVATLPNLHGGTVLTRADDMLTVVRTALEQYLATAEPTLATTIDADTLLFDVCAHSVALLQVYTLLVDALGGLEFPTSALFDYPSVGELAEYLADLV